LLLEFFEDKHVMIICTSPEQLVKWTSCNYFQIDLSFKRVAGEMNEFEVNYYDTEHNLSKFFYQIYFNFYIKIL